MSIEAFPLSGGGVDQNGVSRVQKLDNLGQTRIAGTTISNEIATTERFLACRGVHIADASKKLFSDVSSGTGASATHNSTTGMYELTSGTASGGYAVHIHNDVAFYVEGFPVGFIITCAMAAAIATNTRVEVACYGGVASSNTALQTVDAIGFYFDNGEVGVFYRNVLTGSNVYPANTVDIAQADWLDPLDGAGPSKLTFTPSDITKQTFLEVKYVWLGSNAIEWYIGGILVHRVDFRWGASRISVPFARVPHMRPAVYMYNHGAATANAVYVNCLSGFRDTLRLPKSQQYVFDRPTARAALPNGTELPFAAFRVQNNATNSFRQFYAEWAKLRATGQNVRVKAYWGVVGATRDDFQLTGTAWTATATAGSNPECGIEHSIADMGWTPNYAAIQRVPGDLILNASSESIFVDLAHAFASSEEWIGVDGDGQQRVLVLTATALAGANATIELTEIHGRVMG